MQVFPHFLCRIGGMPFNALAQLEASNTAKAIDDLFLLQQELAAQRSRVCDLLHPIVAQQQDHRLQNLVLNIRRSIFNERKVKEQDLAELWALINAETTAALKEFLQTEERFKQARIESSEIFKQDVYSIRQNLKKLAQDPALQKGLLLSSQTLLNNLSGYLERDPASLRKKELKTEESLVKYLSRMTAKTSPFSTFTNLSLGKISTNTVAPNGMLQYSKGKEREVYSHICLNNYLYSFIKAILCQLPEIYRWFPIRPNPTIRLEEGQYVFLTNSNNIEAFQRITANGVIELFHELTQDKKEGVVMDMMVNDIIENEYFDAERPEIEAYINQLISYGFLEYNIGVSGIDPHWDSRLVEVLQPLTDKSPLIEALISMLQDVRKLAYEYEKADLNRRRSILREAYDRFRGTSMQLHEAAGLPEDERKTPEELAKAAQEKKEAEAKEKKSENESGNEKEKQNEKEDETEEAFTHKSSTFFHFKPEQLFYEDTTVNLQAIWNEKEAHSFADALQSILGTMSEHDGFLEETEKMRQYFLNKYGADAQVSLMNYYEDFFKDIKKPEAEQVNKAKERAAEAAKKAAEKKEESPIAEEKAPEPQQPEKPVIEVPITAERYKKNKEWTQQFAKQFFEKEAISDRLTIRKEQLRPLPTKNDPYPRSFGSFIQVFEEDGKSRAVINSAFPGYGKMFSRFLHILDQELYADLRKWNKTGSEEHVFIENCDASFFNANLHPPLMPFEVWMPGGQNTLPAEEQIPVTELNICFDKEKDTVILKHSSGKEAYSFDLGFQGHKGRSQLFQLLSKFSLFNYVSWHPLTQALNLHINPKDTWNTATEPIVSPRIYFEDRIVLQRKSWLVKKALLPVLEPTDTEWDYFERVNLWRKKFGLPDEVFVFITNHGEMEGLQAEQMRKLGRDSYKPQYINFNHPLLVVNLLEKMIDKVPLSMRFEEMLPHSGHMQTINGERYVTEFMLQWYMNSEAALQSGKAAHSGISAVL